MTNKDVAEEPIYDTVIGKHWFILMITKLRKAFENQEIPGHVSSNFGQWQIPKDFVIKYSNDEEFDEQQHPFYSTLLLIWDLSIMKGISQFMVDHRHHMLFIDISQSTRTDRIKEICVGILANMACHEGLREVMGREEYINEAISDTLISSYDAGVMAECLRYICGILTAPIDADVTEHLVDRFVSDPDFLTKIIFTLHYSSNEGVLVRMADLLCTLLEAGKVSFESPQTLWSCMEALYEGFSQIISMETEASKCRDFIHAFHNIVTDHVTDEIVNETSKRSPNIVVNGIKILVKFFKYCTHHISELNDGESLNGIPDDFNSLDQDRIDNHNLDHVLPVGENTILASLEILKFLIRPHPKSPKFEGGILTLEDVVELRSILAVLDTIYRRKELEGKNLEGKNLEGIEDEGDKAENDNSLTELHDQISHSNDNTPYSVKILQTVQSILGDID